ncbi:rho GTPase-activating protein 45-like isoform X2 [Haliotis rubra]|uniref:rho GTPase-activating protein 45-like isoform X2 n=1 Tax=Haliotis rubra TaxID=36100 RepID=UPI001EE5F3F9|nr:rho GTPase-activating protein 45-like isoform X2 [Haliotis rubra]
MSSKGRKLAKNIGKSLRKKFTDSEGRPDQQQESVYTGGLEIDLGEGQVGGAGLLQPTAPGQQKVLKSTSLGSINNEDGSAVIVDQDDIIALTTDVKSFSDALAKLKTAFTSGTETADEAHVLAHERLGEVICILKNVLNRYPALHSTDLFSSAGTLIGKIKGHNYESGRDPDVIQGFCDAIDQLALAFSSSVSEYLMGGGEPELSVDARTKSYDNLTTLGRENRYGSSTLNGKSSGQLSAREIDSSLVRLEAGLDLALQRAKAWSKYARDIMTYIEKKAQLECEYSKNLSRLAQTMRPVLTDEGFLPLQSVYCTVLAQDIEFASNCQATQALLQTSKFIEPLAARKAEHDKVRKSVKEIWVREVKKMQDAVTGLRKAQHMYIARQQDYEKAHEQAQKTDSDKHDKRKKLEEDAMHKAAEAETTYKACVVETNHRQQELDKIKAELLGKIREQIQMCDQVMKSVTVEYFQLLHTVSAPLPVQFHTLCESSKTYEPGSQYAEFVRRLPIPTPNSGKLEHFSFEAFVAGAKYGEGRKPSTQSNGSASSDMIPSNEGSPVSSPRKDKNRGPVKAWGHSVGIGSDTDSASGSSSNKSHDSSPSNSPHANMRRQLVASQSLDELAEEEPEKYANGDEQRRNLIKRIMSASEDLPNRGRRHTTFGVDFQEQVNQFKMEVPPIVSMCLSEVELRGLTIKGMYRVSGVKSKVENLCNRFDIDPDSVDLSEQHPNVISNVLKLYLRQLPEPLLTFRLYSDFIHVAKEHTSGAMSNQKTIEKLSYLVQMLPPSNFKTCAVLMHHLQRVAAHSDVNQMSSSNLGIVFGPTLLRPAEGTASLASLVDTPHQTRAIELLISSAQTIFGPGADYQLVGGETPVEALPDPAPPVVKQTKSEIKEPLTVSVPSEPPSVKLPSSQSVDAVAVDKIVQPAEEVDGDRSKTSGAEFVLPGSTSPGKSDNISPTSTLTEGDDEWNDLDLQLDDELPDNLLPDDSTTPGSANHQAVLTPHCMAGQEVAKVSQSSSTSRPASSPTTSPPRPTTPDPQSTAALASSPALTKRSSVHEPKPKPTLSLIACGDVDPSVKLGSEHYAFLPPSPIKVVITEVGDSDDAHTEEIQVRAPKKVVPPETSPMPAPAAVSTTRSPPRQGSPPKRVTRSGSGSLTKSDSHHRSSGTSGTTLPSLTSKPESRRYASQTGSSPRKGSTGSSHPVRTSVTTVPTSSRVCLSRSMTAGAPASAPRRLATSSSMTSRSHTSSSLSKSSAPVRRSLELTSSPSRQMPTTSVGSLHSRQRHSSGSDGINRSPPKSVERKNSGSSASSGSGRRSHDSCHKNHPTSGSVSETNVTSSTSSTTSCTKISQDRTPRFV